MTKSKIIIVVIGLLFFITYMDYITGTKLTITEFYLIPIIFGAWFLNKRPAYFIATLAVIMASTIRFIEANHSMFYYSCWDLILDSINFYLITYLVLRVKLAFDNEKTLSRVDFLTGAINSKGFAEILEIEINRAKRVPSVLSLAYIDCDNFKAVNDKMGHEEGNKVLSIVANTIKNNIRKTDFVARLGGDEFALLLTGASPENSLKVLNKLRDLLLYKMEKAKYPVTFSIGLATFINPPDSTDVMLKVSDILMYQVKSDNKNAIKQEVFHENDSLKYI
ncbi:MAG: GGDEF domain-containing protein [bacterium]